MKSQFWYRLLGNIGYFTLIIVLVLSLSQLAFAGKLDDFEQDATREEEERDEEWLYFEDEEDDDDGIFGDILWGIFKGIFGMFGNNDEYDDDNDGEFVRPRSRESGPVSSEGDLSFPRAPAFPVLRFDVAYQNVESDVGAFDTRVELGFNALAAQGRFTWYTEGEPSDDLGLYQIHGLLRVALGNHLKVGLGAGTLILDGNDRNYGFSMTSPVLIYPNEFVGLEFRPTWSWINENPINDYDLGLALNYEFAAVRLGYRWMRSKHESLDGPYAGFSLKF